MTAEARNENRQTFFRFSVHLGAKVTRFKLLNESDFPGGFYPLEQGIRGFAKHRVAGIRPKYLVEGTSSQVAMMAQPDNGFFIVSSAVKDVLGSVDPEAFEFMSIEARTNSCIDVPGYWLCDIVRSLDAVDEERSSLRITTGNLKLYYLVGQERLVFKDNVVEKHHIFRLTYSPRYIVCDEIMRKACKHAGLEALGFDAIHTTL